MVDVVDVVDVARGNADRAPRVRADETITRRTVMSWSISKTIGEPARVRDSVTEQFDRAAKAYAGTPEGDDVLAAKATVLSWLERVPSGKAALVEASGSRGDTWCTVKVDCSTAELA